MVYRGERLKTRIEQTCGWKLEMVKRPSKWGRYPIDVEPEMMPRFTVLRRRWVVERTFAWVGRYRRMNKCLVLQCDGVGCLSLSAKETLWDNFYMAAPATTAALRRAIQHSQESIARLAKRYHLNAKTLAKWRKRITVEDAPMEPRQPRSTVLTAEQETMIVAFRQRTLLALDDCLYPLQASIPNLTRSSLHRCLQRHGISRLPEVGDDKPVKKKFAKYALGYFHLDIAEVHTEQGRLSLCRY
jgi:transposase